MKILYRQSKEDQSGALSRYGVHNCYFKNMSVDRDRRSITKKTHHHTGFEMHIITDGCQEYEANGRVYKLAPGNFLMIYPDVPHTIIASTPHTRKYSITFNRKVSEPRSCFCGILNQRMSDDLTFIVKEASMKKEISETLIDNSILEIIVSVFRMMGIKENNSNCEQSENEIVCLAKQYIDDNIEMSPSVGDVSEYCHFSTKQLTRIFRQFADVSPGEYITQKRIERIEKLLVDQTLSLKEISEIMHFGNEYYFNSFFKKHSGMPPGEYRKMLGK